MAQQGKKHGSQNHSLTWNLVLTVCEKKIPQQKIKSSMIAIKTSISNSSVIIFLSVPENLWYAQNRKLSLSLLFIHCTRPFYEMNLGNPSGFRDRGCLSLLCVELSKLLLWIQYSRIILFFWNKSEEFSSYSDMAIQNFRLLTIK